MSKILIAVSIVLSIVAGSASIFVGVQGSHSNRFINDSKTKFESHSFNMQTHKLTERSAINGPCPDLPPIPECEREWPSVERYFHTKGRVLFADLEASWQARTPASDELWIVFHGSNSEPIQFKGSSPVRFKIPEEYLLWGNYTVSVKPVLGGATDGEVVLFRVTLAYEESRRVWI